MHRDLAWVEYKSVEEAAKALEAMDGGQVSHGGDLSTRMGRKGREWEWEWEGEGGAFVGRVLAGVHPGTTVDLTRRRT